MTEIREMQLDDLEQVMEIENENFSRPWTETGFFTFLIRQDSENRRDGSIPSVSGSTREQ